MTQLIEEWSDIFPDEGEPETVPWHETSAPEESVSASGTGSGSGSAPHQSDSDVKLPVGSEATPATETANFSNGSGAENRCFDRSSFGHHLNDLPHAELMPHAWWVKGASDMPPIDPLKALHLWYEYLSHADDPLQKIIWPSKPLLEQWREYSKALQDVLVPQSIHSLHVYEGAIEQTAHSIDSMNKAMLYPIHPKYHRPTQRRRTLFDRADYDDFDSPISPQ
jgi:hypothetical protein